MMNKIIKILFVLIIHIPVCLQAQSTTWQRIFGGPKDDFARISLQTNDGNILMIGEKIVTSINTGMNISQTYLVKFNLYGNILWTRNIGDSIKPNAPTSAIEMNSGNILITYMSNDMGNLMKIDPAGNIIWDSSYVHPISGFYFISLLNNNKNVIINGDMVGGLSYINALYKLDTNGNLLWSKGYNDGSYTGYLNSNDAFYSVGIRNWSTTFINKKDTSGNLIWRKELTNNNNYFRLLSIVPISGTTFITIGNIYLPSQYFYEGLFATKFDSSGNLYWSKNYLSDSLYAREIIRTNNNKFGITGGQGEPVGKLCLIDSLGNLLLKKFNYYDSTVIIDYDRIQNCLDSGFIVSGYYKLSPSDFHRTEFLILKTDKNFNFNSIGIAHNNLELPEKSIIVTTYPNPFNPEINIKIILNKNRILNIELYNLTGKKIKIFVNKKMEAGINNLKLNAEGIGLSSGIYFLKVSDPEFDVINKIIFLK